jgi:sterol desaturase/sphingolipid hydroxylase (fatty acid hydroxylase superfamily)
MSYQELPDPRPASVKYALGRMPRGMAMAMMFGLVIVALVGVIGLVAQFNVPLAWGGLAIVAGLLAMQYFVAIRWVDFHKTWPRRRSYRKHRMTR